MARWRRTSYTNIRSGRRNCEVSRNRRTRARGEPGKRSDARTDIHIIHWPNRTQRHVQPACAWTHANEGQHQDAHERNRGSTQRVGRRWTLTRIRKWEERRQLQMARTPTSRKHERILLRQLTSCGPICASLNVLLPRLNHPTALS